MWTSYKLKNNFYLLSITRQLDMLTPMFFILSTTRISQTFLKLKHEALTLNLILEFLQDSELNWDAFNSS